MAQAIDTVHAPSKIRWLLLGIVFMSCLIAYLDRVNLSVCATFIMEDMHFDRVQLGYAMSAFFAAYALTQIPGGILAERWGIRKNGAFAMCWWSLFTFMTPHAWGFASFVVVRFLFGLGEGPLYPNNGTFFAKWFSSKEKAVANSWMSAGTLLGPALGPPLTVFLVTHTSWHWAFYVFGFAGFIATALWWIYARDTPAEHPKINDAELMLITEQSNVQDAVSEASQKIKTPWGKFLKNHRFWAIGFQYMANNYITFLFMSWVPLYLQQSRGVSFKQMGALAGLPFLAAAISTVLTSMLSDRLVRMGKSKLLTRSAFGFFGMSGCAVFLYFATQVDTVAENIILLSLSYGFLGFNLTAAWAACQDIGGKYGGTVATWMNFWGTIAGVAAPVMTALFVDWVGWENAFVISTGIVGSGALTWLIINPDKKLVED